MTRKRTASATTKRRATRRPDPATVADLKPDPENARGHTPRNVGVIVDALHEVGAARSIVIDEDDRILAGNGTVEAAAEAGISNVQVVDEDGETLIAVRRRNLTPAQKRRLALFDNRTTDLSAFDVDQLRQDADAGRLAGLFTQDELDALFAQDVPARVEGLTVDRPTDVAWVLLAIPVEQWPAVQSTVEGLQLAATFSTMVLRPKEAHDGGSDQDR